MFRIIDRYIIRELILPFLLGLVVFTFLLMIQPLADYSEQLISKGVSWTIVVRVLVTLIPQALAITIPIALLIGLLIAFGRLSADRESVAFMACGISIYRLLRPVLFVAAVAWAATSWIMIDALPDANQSFREIVYGVITARAENEIKPRVFFEDFPNQILYIGDAPTTGGWRDVFLADTSNGRIVRKLVDTSLDPHFSSLEFISSAGSWKSDSRQFVVGAVRKGQPELAIIDPHHALVRLAGLVPWSRFEEAFGRFYRPIY